MIADTKDTAALLTRATESRRYSQNGEDGVLQHLFDLLGRGNGRYVEIGCEDGTECNTRLLRESGWSGWMFDAAHERPDIGLFRNRISRENVLAILSHHKVPRHFDLLSLDIDFNDFHVLDAILAEHRPRVIVVEYNASLGPDLDAVVPYRPDGCWDGTRWFGASLGAFARLAAAHGYVPVYCESAGVNLFLVEQGEWPHPARPLAEIYRPPRYGAAGDGHAQDPASRPFLSSSHYLIPGAARSYTPYGQVSYLVNDEYIGRVFAGGGYWEELEVTQVARQLAGRQGVALDVGAHIGSHALALAALCPELTFICFEPQSGLRLLLERNVAENGLSERIVVSDKAIAHQACPITMAGSFSDGSGAQQAIRYDGSAFGNYGGVQIGVDGEVVDALALDALADLPVVYMKVDVEGAERLAFFGAKHLLERQRPLILFEHRSDRQLPPIVLEALRIPAEVQRFDVVAHLRGLGYAMSPLGQDTLAAPPAVNPLATTVEAAASASPGFTAVEPDTPLVATASCAASIPKILFQTWKSRTNLPHQFAQCRSSFLDANPSFAAPLWDDADNRRFVQLRFPWFLPLFDSYPREIYRADAVRYLFLYAFGGVYADLDMICLQPLDRIAGLPNVLLGRMGADGDFEHSLPNAAMASPPRHPFWLLVIAKLIEAQTRLPHGRPEHLTGPVALKSANDEWAQRPECAQRLVAAVARHLPPELCPAAPSPICILASADWFPFNWADPIHQIYRRGLLAKGRQLTVGECRALFPTASMVTFWSHSWEPEAGLPQLG
ncbi:MAG: hypothetical protein ABT20_06665 [Rubrivivax sp. SCN 70-15]|nr:MAG: hypothetical protein ABT20_06665 [Rubrivivax sp. SCN 70-15]